MEPEETDPELLVGRHVVEVGLRQAWLFLTIADSVTGREVRVYVDAPFSPTRGAAPLRQDDDAILATLDRVVGGTVTAARVDDGALVLEVEGKELRVSGEANELTSGSPWWVGLQASATKEQQDGVADVQTEVVADVDAGETFDFSTEVSPEDRVCAEPGEDWWAYRRRESDDGSA